MKLKLWQFAYLLGFVIVIGLAFLKEFGLHFGEIAFAIVELIGGILLIGGACEAFVISVEGIAHNYKMTDYVSGIYASLASTIPELSVIVFLLINGRYEMAWVLALATIFMNSLSLSSLATGPNIRVPLISSRLFSNTTALSSKRM